MTESFHDVGAEADLLAGKSLACLLNGWPVIVSRSDGGIFAVINRCSHAEAELGGGRVRRNIIACPLHGARFELATGKCIGAPYQPLRTFPVEIESGRIHVAVPDEAPGHEHAPVRLANA